MAKTRIMTQIEPDLLAQVRALAAEENRSISNLIETLLKQYIAEAEANGWVYETPPDQSPAAG